MSKTKLIPIILALILVFAPLASRAADTSKTVTYYVSENGEFKEKLRWVMNNAEEWNRFDAFSSRFRNSDHHFSPIDKSSATTTPDMIVISDQNKNLGTGRDYYLTQSGVTIAERAPKYRFFHDQKGFYNFLKAQQKAASVKSSSKDIQNAQSGLRVIYQISNELSNPNWLVTSPSDLNVYYDFFKGNAELKDNSKSLQNMNILFDQKKYIPRANFITHIRLRCCGGCARLSAVQQNHSDISLSGG